MSFFRRRRENSPTRFNTPASPKASTASFSSSKRTSTTAASMALTYKQSVLVQGSIPVLREHGETITTLFYANMLRAHPELHDMFNTVNQANGRQPRALTSIILTFASNLHNISELIPRLERMCNKHCSLGIQPEHYEIVGKYLLQAFSQILGPTWTPDVQEAWHKAYWILARMLIGRESQMYRDFEDWQGFRKFRVERKVAETDDIFSLYLAPADGKRLPEFTPGQYVTVRLDVPALGHTQMRQYSLSDAPRADYYRVTVKRDPGSQIGKGVEAVQLEPGIVSNILVEDTQEGDVVEVSHPSGDFLMDMDGSSTVPVVLISAGVGVSPLMSILETVAARQPTRPVSWLHCSARAAPFEARVRRIAAARTAGGAPFATRFFRSKVADLDDGASTASGEAGLRMDLARIDPAQLYLGHGACEYYICGPEAFMQEMAKYLVDQGVDASRVKFEWFSTGDLVFRK